MPIGVSLALVAVFLAMNAFFVIAEFAMVRVRPSQIDIALAENKAGAKAAKRVTSNVNAYLAACQLGITLASDGWVNPRSLLSCDPSWSLSAFRALLYPPWPSP